jgi:hypothetical protein
MAWQSFVWDATPLAGRLELRGAAIGDTRGQFDKSKFA